MTTSLHQSNLPTANRIRLILLDFGLSASALTEHADFTRDLGLDSLDTTDLLLRVEMTFDVRIVDCDWNTLRTIGDVTTYLLHEHNVQPEPARTVLLTPSTVEC